MVPIHAHTYYSTLDGKSTPADIASRLKEIGCECGSCSDHGTVAGHPEFYKTLTNEGLKPLLAIEAYQAATSRTVKEKGDSAHLILLAKDNAGLRNLWSLSTESGRSGFYYYPRCDWELLRKYRKGVICTSACLGGLLSQSILYQWNKADSKRVCEDPETLMEKYLDIFRDDFYVELSTYDSDQQRLVNHELAMLAQKRGVPVVFASDSHYARKEDYDLHEAMMALSMGKKLDDPKRMTHPPCLYILSEDEVRTSLEHLGTSLTDEAIDNSDRIASMCNVSLPERRNRVPVFAPEKGWKTNKEMFIDLSVRGYEKKIVKYGKDGDEYWDRFTYELNTIIDADLMDYFLIVRDYIYEAKRQGIMVGPGRGSSGGSLIAYCLGITEIEPIQYGLIFERFYNAGREKSLPDIDTDFAPDRIEDIFSYLGEKYGHDHVGYMGTVTRMQGKQAVKDVGRVLGVGFDDLNKISEIINETVDAGLTADWKTIDQEVGDKLEPYIKKHPQLFEWARELFDHVRAVSQHASAVIIADEPLDGTFPLRNSAKDKKMISQWDMHVAEDLGYLKVDLLKVVALSTLTEMNRLLVENKIEPINYDELQYREDLPEEMWQILDKGLTVGIFQVEEGSSAKQIIRAIKPRSIEELGICVAMNRPGPLRSGAVEKYMAAKETGFIEVDHPILESVLERTKGCWLFQEQILEFLAKINYSLGDADHIRKIMGKKKREELAPEFPRFMKHAADCEVEAFCPSCWNIMGKGNTKHCICGEELIEPEPYEGEGYSFMDPSDAIKIWRDLVGFASYGFNKSHSIAYAIVLLWTLYAKWYAATYFILAGIRTESIRSTPDVSRWIEEALRMRIEVMPPDVNRSDVETTVVDGEILFGLRDIKGMGISHSKWVVDHRPYSDYEQFLEETRKDENKATLPSGIRKILLDSGRAEKLYNVGAFDSMERRRVSKAEKIAWEEELLGVALSDDSAKILLEMEDVYSKFCVPYSAIEGPGKYNVAGVVKEVRERKTKKGDPMAFVKIAQDADELEFAVWSQQLESYSFLLKKRVPLVASLKKTDRGMHLEQARMLQ